MSKRNLLSSKMCGCFYCETIFTPQDIVEWVDDGQTALCPKCGIDSVIGDGEGHTINEEMLRERRKKSFGLSGARK